jgi:hypothetical protein
METAEKQRGLSGLNLIFWGYLLVFLDFKINNFDILPDFLGYILILVGIGSLLSFSVNFSNARPFAIIALILSFFDFYQINISLNNLQSIPSGLAILWGILLGVADCVFDMLLLYFLIRGMAEIARSRGDVYLERRGMQIFKWLLITGVIFTVAAPLIFVFQMLAVVITFAVGILSLIIWIMFLYYIRQIISCLNGWA